MQKLSISQVELIRSKDGSYLELGSGTFAHTVLGFFHPLSCFVAVKRLNSKQSGAKLGLINEAKVSTLLNCVGGAPYIFGVRSESEAVYELLTVEAAPVDVAVQTPLLRTSGSRSVST